MGSKPIYIRGGHHLVGKMVNMEVYSGNIMVLICFNRNMILMNNPMLGKWSFFMELSRDFFMGRIKNPIPIIFFTAKKRWSHCGNFTTSTMAGG